jgi:hypothetical protein
VFRCRICKQFIMAVGLMLAVDGSHVHVPDEALNRQPVSTSVAVVTGTISTLTPQVSGYFGGDGRFHPDPPQKT